MSTAMLLAGCCCDGDGEPPPPGDPCACTRTTYLMRVVVQTVYERLEKAFVITLSSAGGSCKYFGGNAEMSGGVSFQEYNRCLNANSNTIIAIGWNGSVQYESGNFSTAGSGPRGFTPRHPTEPNGCGEVYGGNCPGPQYGAMSPLPPDHGFENPTYTERGMTVTLE